jgi:hypothetical protein
MGFEVTFEIECFLPAETHCILDFEALLPTSEAFLTLNNAEKFRFEKKITHLNYFLKFLDQFR